MTSPTDAGSADAVCASASSGSAGPALARRSAQAGLLLVLTYLGFVSLGLPDAAYGVAWPSLRTEFGLPQGAFGLGLLAVAIGFFFSSLAAGTMLDRFGAGRLLAGSTFVSAAGLVAFSFAPSWPLYLAAGLFVGLGGGAIDSGLNAYAARHYSARQMNWLHAAFGFGAALGPLIMTYALTAAGWRVGYATIAGLMALLAILFLATRRRWSDADDPAQDAHAVSRVPVGAALRSGVVWLQTLTFFVYAGIEIGAGQWAFAILTQARGYSIEAAGLWTGGFWFALFAGRLLLGFAADMIGPDRLIGIGSATAFAALAMFAIDPYGLGVVGLAVSGFAMAPIFPMLMHRTPRLMGSGLAAHSIGFQVSAAMMGGVALPAAAGLAAAMFGLDAVAYLLTAGAALHLLLARLGLSREPHGSVNAT